MAGFSFFKRHLTSAFCIMLLFWSSIALPQAMKEFGIAKKYAAGYNIDSAYVHMQKALTLSNKATDRTKALMYLHYGKLLKLKEKTDSSFIYFNKALEIHKKHGNKDSLVFVTASIAEVFRFRDNKEQAMQYIKHAEKLLSVNTRPDITAYYYNRRAAIENQFGSNILARNLSEKVIAMQEEVIDKEIIVYSYNELGAIYEYADRVKSRGLYNAALALADKHKLLIAKANILVNLARLAKNVDERIDCLEEAYSLSLQTGNRDMRFKISNLLFWPYKEKGDYKKAFEYCYEALYLEEKMYDSRALARTVEIERKYNLEKAEEDLRFKNIEVESAQKTTFLSIIIATLILVVLLIGAYFYRKTSKSNKMLAELSVENEFLLSEANHRINNNLQLITIMISDELRKHPENQHQLNKVLSKVESIAVLHRHLYKSADKRHMNVGKYLQEVLDNFSEVFSEQGIVTKVNIENIYMPNEDAIYMGLLVTELCINTLKHAFAEQDDKELAFDFEFKDDKVFFRFSDNGRDVIGKEIKPVLIGRLCRQLKVKCNIDTGNGFLFYFEKKLET